MRLPINKLPAAPLLPEPEEKLPDTAVSALGLAVVTIILLFFGLTMLYSASFTLKGIVYFKKQLLWILAGFAAGGVVFMLGYQRICKLRGPLLLFCWLMLVAALFFDAYNGAYRWIRFPFPGLGTVALQPSEFAKIAMCLWVASYCTYNSRTFSLFKHRNGIIPLAVYIMITCGLVALGQDMGTTILIFCTAGAVMLAAGLYLRYFAVGLAFGAAAFVVTLFCSPVRLKRVTNFLDPEANPLKEGYQLLRSLWALGSGGWFGLGFGESRLKTKYLPEQHTDFILSVVGEELGFSAICLIILFYLLWGFFAVRIAISARSKLGMLLAFGLTMAIQLQALINLSVISGSIPTKGMPAPFISYGGSNVFSSIIAVALLLSVAMETARPGYSDAFLNSLREKFRKKK